MQGLVMKDMGISCRLLSCCQCTFDVYQQWPIICTQQHVNNWGGFLCSIIR
ncbi:hypothetical protein CEXT_323921, partial [Caerostris extrusa]